MTSDTGVKLNLRELVQGIMDFEERKRKLHKEIHAKHLAYYNSLSDESMPFVFAEFQKGLGRRLEFSENLPTNPLGMRKYLARAHTSLEISDMSYYD